MYYLRMQDLNKYKTITEVIEGYLKVKEAELQKFVADAQKKLKDAASPVERKNLEDKLSNEYKTKRH